MNAINIERLRKTVEIFRQVRW